MEVDVGGARHQVLQGDCRELLGKIPDSSVHLICTSPPYGALKIYPTRSGQLGNESDYGEFLDQLDKVWQQSLRVLVPGGRLACVVGDICLARKDAGRHHVLPLAADITVRARRIGFDCLNGIKWLKVANVSLESSRSSRFMGKPNLPNGIIKNDMESILMFRKPGGYRTAAADQVRDSRINTTDYIRWFLPVWSDVPGVGSTDHPAPFPIEIPRRLVRMFTFVDDVVVDPFAGTGSTAVAAMGTGRRSLSIELEPSYIQLIERRIVEANASGVVRFVADNEPERHVGQLGLFDDQGELSTVDESLPSR